ncbi:MAG: T9SS type A sorting domain-containing protein [Bacteroidia bacterium]|nr:T9SS type A sorting domain-containing protein [Bacteroidia bacterium]
MRSSFKLGFAAITLSLSLSAQQSGQGRGCGTPPPGQQWDNWFNIQVDAYKQSQANGTAKAAPYVIPVVVHVIHGGQNIGNFPNITQTQINSQISILNNDFAGTGLGASSLPTVFSGLKANTNITFCLAKLDPNGNCLPEPGIDRVDYRQFTTVNPNNPSSSAAFIAYFDANIKPGTIWDPKRYLNLWVSDVSAAAQLLGYATFPGGTGLSGLSGFGGPSNDGVWVHCKSFGNVGSLNSPYDKGRTATHEIGHWLGLRHIWGDGACATDYCTDTPPAQTDNFGCPTHPYKLGVCSGNTTGEMFQNFMDYTDDGCLALFTNDQNTRIQTAMANCIYRNQLTASAATLCTIPTAAPDALFTMSSNSICVDSAVVMTNQSTGGPCPLYVWSVNPASGYSFVPSSGTVQANPKIKFTAVGFYTITLSATNASGNSTLVDYVDVYDCFNEVGLAESNYQQLSLMLVPNPSEGVFSILMRSGNGKNVNVKVYNSLGEVIYTQNNSQLNENSISINLSNQPAGIYTVQIENEGKKAVKRLVLNK